ncbi:MAG: hypothetical protein GY796_23120 [Chloroflexi bacterium]|nr:hypothetical protein [Chloroflexota bacterium]
MYDGLIAVGQNLLQTAVWMVLFLAALWIIYFIDSLLLKGKLKQRFGLIPHSHFSFMKTTVCVLLSSNQKSL